MEIHGTYKLTYHPMEGDSENFLSYNMHVGMVMEIYGTYKLTYHPVERDSEKVFEVDFTPPFRRVEMIPELEK